MNWRFRVWRLGDLSEALVQECRGAEERAGLDWTGLGSGLGTGLREARNESRPVAGNDNLTRVIR